MDESKPDAFLIKGVSWFKLNNLHESNVNLNKVIETNSNDSLKSDALFYIGLNKHFNGKYREAIEEFEKSLRFNKANFKSLTWISFCHKNLNELSLAENLSNESIVQCNECLDISEIIKSEVYYYKALNLYLLEKYDDSLEVLEKVFKLNPLYSDAFMVKADILAAKNKTNDALEMANKSIQSDPLNARAYSIKADLLFKLKKFDLALKMYDKCIQLRPHSYMEYFRKGQILYSLKKYDEAFECIDKSIEFFPLHNLEKGLLLLCLNKQDEALICFDKFIKVDYNNYLDHFFKILVSFNFNHE